MKAPLLRCFSTLPGGLYSVLPTHFLSSRRLAVSLGPFPSSFQAQPFAASRASYKAALGRRPGLKSLLAGSLSKDEFATHLSYLEIAVNNDMQGSV